MPYYRYSINEVNQHYLSHRNRRLNLEERRSYCQLCHPILPLVQISAQFSNFWTWISTYHYAYTYTEYTEVAFNNIVRSIELASDWTVVAGFITYTVTSIKYQRLSLFLFELCYCTQVLFEQTHDFADPVTPQIIDIIQQRLIGYRQIIENLDQNPPQNNNTMDEGQLNNVLRAVLGENGLNIADILQGRNRPRELNLVKVDPFYGRENEDPYEWIESFKQAANANQWPMARWPDIALGYLREAARDWFITHQKDLG